MIKSINPNKKQENIRKMFMTKKVDTTDPEALSKAADEAFAKKEYKEAVDYYT